MGVQTYDITHYQPILFCAEGFGEVEDVVGAFFAEVDDEWWSGCCTTPPPPPDGPF